MASTPPSDWTDAAQGHGQDSASEAADPASAPLGSPGTVGDETLAGLHEGPTDLGAADGLDSAAVDAVDGIGAEETNDGRIDGDAGLNQAEEASGTEDKVGVGVVSESEMAQSGQTSVMDQRDDAEITGAGGSKVVDIKDKGGDGVASESKLMAIQSWLSSGKNQSADIDAEDKGSFGVTNESELMNQSVDAEADDNMKEDDTKIEGHSTVNDGVSPMEVDQCSQQEDENPMPEDGVADSKDVDNQAQAGEPEPSKEAHATVEHVPLTSSVEKDPRARYYMFLQDENTAFSTSDLVWGKVKSHPWWPGEIFDPSHASELALKHQKEGKFLIAYFEDKTFAWNDKTQLKPFSHFSQLEKQSKHETFTNAVNSALEEVARRVEMGLTCACFADESYAAMKQKTVVNAGLQEGTHSAAVDWSLIVNSFEPDELLQCVKALAQYPHEGADRLELVLMKAQMKAFYHSKGFQQLPVFLAGTGMVENDSEDSPSIRKESPKDIIDSSTLIPSASSLGKRGRGNSSGAKDGKKERKVSELMEEKDVSHHANASRRGSGRRAVSRSLGKAHKDVDHHDTPDLGRRKKKRLKSLGDLETKTPSPRSAKVGERISRIANQMTGSPPIIKSNGKTKNSGMVSQRKGRTVSAGGTAQTLAEISSSKRGATKAYSSPSEVLAQLFLAASDPMKGYSFQPTLTSFITGFRASISSKDKEHVATVGSKRGKRKSTNAKSASEESDHMKDSYWSDVIFHDSLEEDSASSENHKKRASKSRGGKKKIKPASEALTLPSDTLFDVTQSLQVDLENPGNLQELAEERAVNDSGENTAEEYTPTALILSFKESDTLPSGVDLINTFSRFGPLEEAQTEILAESNRAKVVFRKRVDAETACSSAGRSSLFGPALVSYRLKILSSPMKAVPAIKQQDNDASPDEPST